MKWTAAGIGRAMALHFERRHLVIVPNCNWTGHECDLLVVTQKLLVIDVEIKISRSDLKADFGKDKWYHNWDFAIDGPWTGRSQDRRRRDVPRRVWKHYYCMPASIWKPELLETIPAASGVLLLTAAGTDVQIRSIRPATASRTAEKLSPEAAIDIARLASLRMWDSYRKLEQQTSRSRNGDQGCG